MILYSRKLFYLLIFILLQACSSSGIAPVSNRNEIKDPPPNISKSGKSKEEKKPQRTLKTPKKVMKRCALSSWEKDTGIFAWVNWIRLESEGT